MRLTDFNYDGHEPIFTRRGLRAAGESIMGHLKLRFDDEPSPLPHPDDAIPFPALADSGPSQFPHRQFLRLAPVDGFQDPIQAVEHALDRMSRQLGNLRDLLGDDLGATDTPRAA